MVGQSDIDNETTRDKVAEHISWKDAITRTCNDVHSGLLKHHEKYGTAIFRPVTILSSASAEQTIRIKIDDRIRKLQNLDRTFSLKSAETERELIDDLIGYLVNFRAFMVVHNPEVWREFE